MANPNIDELTAQFEKIKEVLGDFKDYSFKDLSTQQLADDFDKISKTVEKIKSMKGTLNPNIDSHTALLKKYNAQLLKARSINNKLIKQHGKLDRSLPAWADNTSRITDLVNKMQDYYKGVKQVIKNNKELQAGLVLLTLTSDTFSKSLKFAGGVISSILKGAYKFVEYMTTMPIKVGEYAGKMGNTLRQELVEVIGQATEGAKEFFDLSSNGGEAISRLGSIAGGALGSFQSVNSELTKTFGFGATGAANMVSQLSQGINNMGVFADVFAKSTTNSTQSILFFQRMTKGMGMSAEDTSYIVAEAMKNGEHYFETMTRVKESSDAASKEFGINRKRLTMGFFNLRKDIIQFGHLSEPALMAVVGKATQLGVSIESLKGVFSKFDTFENAAQSAAVLQQTFGMNIDALQLIRAENPMQIVEMFRESMMMTGRSFDDLNRHEKSLMATHTGMSAETLKTVMNYRNVGKSFEDIKKIMNDQKPEERQIKAMKDMRSQMVETRKVIEGKGFFDNFLEGVGKTIRYNTALGKTYVKVSQRMEDFYEKGLSLSKRQKKSLNRALEPLNSSLTDLISKDGPFGKKSFDKLKNGVILGFGNFIDDVFGDKDGNRKNWIKAQLDWEQDLKKTFSFDNLSRDQSYLGKLFRSSGKIIGKITKALIVGLPAITEVIGSVFTDGLTEIDKILSGSNSQFGASILKWLGFDSSEYSEIFGAIRRGLGQIRDKFFGKDSDQGFIVKAISRILSISSNIGSRIAQGISENKDAINQLTDQVSFGMFTKFSRHMIMSGVFDSIVTESQSRSVAETNVEGTVKRYGRKEATQQLLGEKIKMSLGDKQDESQMLRGREIAAYIQSMDKQRGGRRFKGQSAITKGFQGAKNLHHHVDNMLHNESNAADIFIGPDVLGVRHWESGAKSYFFNRRERKDLSKMVEGKESSQQAMIILEQIRKKGIRMSKVLDDVLTAEENARIAALPKGKKLKKGGTGTFASIISPGQNVTTGKTKTRRSADPLTGFKPTTGQTEKFEIKTSLPAQSKLPAFKELNGKPTSLPLLDGHIYNRIAKLVTEASDDKGMSAADFEKLYNDHSERTLEMRKEFEDFIIQNKDNDVHVVVTIDNYELTSHIKRTMTELGNDQSKAPAQTAMRSRMGI